MLKNKIGLIFVSCVFCLCLTGSLWVYPAFALKQLDDPCTDNDLDGWCVEDGDCDDNDPFIYPGAEEVPGDGIDQNCDGSDAAICYADADGDGYGDIDNMVVSSDGDCTDPGEAATGTDCYDMDPMIHPGATEVPDDGIDQDCNGFDATMCIIDADMDGFGNDSGNTVIAGDGICDQAEGESIVASDCDDSENTIYPGATEIPDDGIDQNCDGSDLVTVAVETVTWSYIKGVYR